MQTCIFHWIQSLHHFPADINQFNRNEYDIEMLHLICLHDEFWTFGMKTLNFESLNFDAGRDEKIPIQMSEQFLLKTGSMVNVMAFYMSGSMINVSKKLKLLY